MTKSNDMKAKSKLALGATLAVICAMHARSDAVSLDVPMAGTFQSASSAAADVEQLIHIHRSVATATDWRIGYSTSAAACCTPPPR